MWLMDVKDQPAISGEVEQGRITALLNLNFPGIDLDSLDFKEPRIELEYEDYEITLVNMVPTAPKSKKVTAAKNEKAPAKES